MPLVTVCAVVGGPEQQFKPIALRRKAIEISNNLIALWSGDFSAACYFAELVTDWFQKYPVNKETLISFCDTYYGQRVPNFWAIIVPSNNENWYVTIGDVYRSHSSFAGEYLVAGTGQRIFRDMVDAMQSPESAIVPPDVAGLRIANDLSAREIVTGEPLRCAFGGAYEVFFPGPDGFERVDDVMHAFALVKVSTDIDVHHYSFVMRQWYENDQLCIFSQVTDSGAMQGLKSEGFAIPSVLGMKTQSDRTVDFLKTRPRYLSLHHLFEIDGKIVSSTLTLKADGIDEYFNFIDKSRSVSFEPKDTYFTRLVEQAVAIKKQLGHG